jgi:hypothetical protein
VGDKGDIWTEPNKKSGIRKLVFSVEREIVKYLLHSPSCVVGSSDPFYCITRLLVLFLELTICNLHLCVNSVP